MTRTRIIAISVIVVAFSLLATIGVQYALNRAAFGDVPMTAPPTISSSSVPSPNPSATATASSPTRSTPPQPPVCSGDIGGVPTHIQIKRKGVKKPIADTDIVLAQLDADGNLDPPGGVAGWYGPPDWSTTPGDASKYRGIIAGHVGQDARKGVFYNLHEVKKHDVVTIWYEMPDKSEQTATFDVLKDALSVPKEDVTDTGKYPWVWRSNKSECVVTVFTCDLQAEHDVFGSSINNYIIQARLTTRKR